MKIAVSSTGPTLDDLIDPSFGRCRHFIIIDPDTKAFESIQNPCVELSGGAGIQSAQLVADRGVSVVLTGSCGPKAFRTFEAAGIEVVTGASGTVGQAVDQFAAGTLPTEKPLRPGTVSNAPSTSGSYRGQAQGYGRGMGGGRGIGRGRGTGGSRGGTRGGM